MDRRSHTIAGEGNMFRGNPNYIAFAETKERKRSGPTYEEHKTQHLSHPSEGTNHHESESVGWWVELIQWPTPRVVSQQDQKLHSNQFPSLERRGSKRNDGMREDIKSNSHISRRLRSLCFTIAKWWREFKSEIKHVRNPFLPFFLHPFAPTRGSTSSPSDAVSSSNEEFRSDWRVDLV